MVGGVSQLWQGDLDLGRVAVERLRAAGDLGAHVAVEDFHYGALAVAQHLEDAAPDVLVLVAAEERGRRPGTVERRVVDEGEPALDAEGARAAVEAAGTGHVTVDLLLEVGALLGALPGRTVVVEVEPSDTSFGDRLSPEAAAGLEEALEVVRADVRRAPLHVLVARLRERLADDEWPVPEGPAVDTLRRLLDAVESFDGSGRPGRLFVLRQELLARMTTGGVPDRLDRLDWALWWALVEEIGRLHVEEASA